jgi:hypothetical protein
LTAIAKMEISRTVPTPAAAAPTPQSVLAGIMTQFFEWIDPETIAMFEETGNKNAVLMAVCLIYQTLFIPTNELELFGASVSGYWPPTDYRGIFFSRPGQLAVFPPFSEELRIHACPDICALPGLSLNRLRVLSISNCPRIKTLDKAVLSLSDLTCLKLENLSFVPGSINFQEIVGSLPLLQTLCLVNVGIEATHACVAQLENLTTFSVSGNANLSDVHSEIVLMPKLEYLDVSRTGVSLSGGLSRISDRKRPFKLVMVECKNLCPRI